jgi:hypothetical protein
MKKKQTMAAIHVRLTPSVKAAAVRMAQEDNRSMAEWLEWLIEAEAARLDEGARWGRAVQMNPLGESGLLFCGPGFRSAS